MTDMKGRGFRLLRALSVGCGMIRFWQRRPVKDADEIARLYRAGYGDGSIQEELDGWAGEGAWLDI